MGKRSTYDPTRIPDTYTIASAQRAAEDLATTGDRDPSVKLACWFAICSGASKLEGSNSSMADTLRSYAERRLPERDVVIGWLRASKANWNGKLLDALFAVDALWAAGLLDQFATRPQSWAEWESWRRNLRSLVRGMSWKMTSMAAYLAWPLDCPLICIDRHHLRRLGYDPERVPQVYSTYHRIEQQVWDEYDALCDALIAQAVWAYFCWSLERKSVGAEPTDDLAADHRRLSVRLY